jgi:hypothetical protein
VELALQEILEREAVHHRAEHAHVVGTGAVQTALLQLLAAEEIATADHHRHLRTGGDDLGDLTGDRLDHPRIDPDAPAAEHLATQLEQHAAISGAGAVGAEP